MYKYISGINDMLPIYENRGKSIPENQRKVLAT